MILLVHVVVKKIKIINYVHNANQHNIAVKIVRKKIGRIINWSAKND